MSLGISKSFFKQTIAERQVDVGVVGMGKENET